MSDYVDLYFTEVEKASNRTKENISRGVAGAGLLGAAGLTAASAPALVDSISDFSNSDMYDPKKLGSIGDNTLTAHRKALKAGTALHSRKIKALKRGSRAALAVGVGGAIGTRYYGSRRKRQQKSVRR